MYVAYGCGVLTVGIGIRLVLLRIVQCDCLIDVLEGLEKISFIDPTDHEGMASFDDQRSIANVLR